MLSEILSPRRDNVVRQDELKAWVLLPMGVRMPCTGAEVAAAIPSIFVSTVRLPPNLRGSDENEYETAIFAGNDRFVALFKRTYMTQEAASAGHAETLSALAARELELKINLAYGVFADANERSSNLNDLA